MDHGWTLETVTSVRENADCRGWFMNYAVDLCHTEEDLDDLVIGEYSRDPEVIQAYLKRPAVRYLQPSNSRFEHVHTSSRPPATDWKSRPLPCFSTNASTSTHAQVSTAISTGRWASGPRMPRTRWNLSIGTMPKEQGSESSVSRSVESRQMASSSGYKV